MLPSLQAHCASYSQQIWSSVKHSVHQHTHADLHYVLTMPHLCCMAAGSLLSTANKLRTGSSLSNCALWSQMVGGEIRAW